MTLSKCRSRASRFIFVHIDIYMQVYLYMYIYIYMTGLSCSLCKPSLYWWSAKRLDKANIGARLRTACSEPEFVPGLPPARRVHGSARCWKKKRLLTRWPLLHTRLKELVFHRFCSAVVGVTQDCFVSQRVERPHRRANSRTGSCHPDFGPKTLDPLQSLPLCA